MFLQVHICRCGSSRASVRWGSLPPISNGSIQLPEARSPDGTSPTIPYTFVADEAFPLKESIMRPFPQRTLNTAEEPAIGYNRKEIETIFIQPSESTPVFKESQSQFKQAQNCKPIPFKIMTLGGCH